MFDFNEATAKNQEMMDAMAKNLAAMANGFQAIATEATDFSKKSVEGGVAHFEKLIAVGSVEAAIELQTNFVKSTYETAVAQATKMTDMVADLSKVAFQPAEASVAAAPKAAPAPKAAAAKASRSSANVKSEVAA